MVWLGRRHLAFAVANCVLNLRFASALLDTAATVGSCGDSWKLRRWVAGEARNTTENGLSMLIVIFFVQQQQTEISERKLFIFQRGGVIADSCGVIADPCGVIADPSGIIADPCGVIADP